jgi:hypothetical protein
MYFSCTGLRKNNRAYCARLYVQQTPVFSHPDFSGLSATGAYHALSFPTVNFCYRTGFEQIPGLNARLIFSARDNLRYLAYMFIYAYMLNIAYMLFYAYMSF